MLISSVLLAISRFMPYNGIIKPSLIVFKIALEGAAALADTVLVIDADVNSRTVLARSLRSAAIHTEVLGSDHCPV